MCWHREKWNNCHCRLINEMIERGYNYKCHVAEKLICTIWSRKNAVMVIYHFGAALLGQNNFSPKLWETNSINFMVAQRQKNIWILIWRWIFICSLPIFLKVWIISLHVYSLLLKLFQEKSMIWYTMIIIVFLYNAT